MTPGDTTIPVWNSRISEKSLTEQNRRSGITLLVVDEAYKELKKSAFQKAWVAAKEL